jgi:hypothetical protein
MVQCVHPRKCRFLQPARGLAPLVCAVDKAARRHVVVYAPDPTVQKWIDEELVGEPCEVSLAGTIALAVDRIVAGDGLRKVLIVDVDALEASELDALDGAWGQGVPLIGLGHVTREMRDVLHLTYVVRRPLGSEKLRAFISGLCDGGDTVETVIQPAAAAS